MGKGFILFLIIFGVVAFAVVGSFISYHNTWTDKNNLYEEQLEVDKVIFDKVWKIIKQQAGVTDKYAQDFRNVYVDMMEARNYGGEAFKWIQEQNPSFNQSMYEKLMNTIEVQRDEFARNQQRLISIHKELKNLKQKFPSNVFLFNKEIPKLVTVTSTKTERDFATGKDDDVDLFESVKADTTN